jgi:acetyl esterase
MPMRAPVLEPVTQHFVDSLAGAPPIHTLAPAEARKRLRAAQAGPVGRPAAQLQDALLPVGPSGEVRVRIVRPERESDELLPVIVYCHGGGFVLGDADTHDRLVRELANGVGAALVFVDYARAPESRFPTALEEIYAATDFVARHAAALDLDASRIAIAGDSAGGNLAAGVALLAKQRRRPRLVFQALLYPVTGASFDTESYESFADGPWLTRAAMRAFWDAYLPDVAARKQVLASPLEASLDELAGLPDALVIVGENDVLRDEGEAYARKLSEAGVRVTSTRYNGTIHDFALLNALADTPATRAAIAQTISALRGALE